MIKKLISKLVKQGKITESFDSYSVYYKLFDRSIVDRAAGASEPGRLLELIAREIGVSLGTILDTVSNHLKIARIDDVFLPKEEFLSSFNSTFDAFKSFAAVPQPCLNSSNYRLVVADPSLVSIDAFRSQGVEVLLGDYASIKDVLNQWSARVTRPVSRIESFFKNIWEAGGEELRITRAESDWKYSFISAQGEMGGRLSVTFLNCLEEFVGDGDRLLTISEFNSIKISRLTSATDRPTDEVVIKLCRFISDTEVNESKEVKRDRVDSKDSCNRLDSPSRFRKDILIVEDDLNFSQTLASIIESKGYSVCCVFSVEEFERCVTMSDLQLRLVISDYRLGGRNGGDVIRACTALHDPIPVIFLTEDSDPRTEASMIQLGTQAFVRKSANPMILLAWISRLLDDSGPVQTADSPSMVLQ